MSIEIKDLSKIFIEPTDLKVKSRCMIKRLFKTIKRENKALDNVSIKIKKNSITGLIGFNGSGKTTTFNILAGFMEPTKGNVLIDGKEPDKDFWMKLSYLAAGAETKNGTKSINHLKSIAKFYGAEKEWAIKKINDVAKKIDFSQNLDKPIKSLSKGNQQKVKIIASLLNPNMEYLFLDEPFDGLDPIMVHEVVKIYEALKDITIIITSHRMEVVQEMTKEFYVLKDGKLVDFKKTDDPTIFVEVNKEISIDAIKKLPYVIEISELKDSYEITLRDMKCFKDLNKKLIPLKGYVWSSMKAKNIAESVFNKYLRGGSYEN